MDALVRLDTHDPTPLYAQLERGIRLAIATGRLRPGDQLPTVRQLAVDLKVNANTVAKVYLGLERDEVVTTKRGVGTFIASAPQKDHTLQRERQLKAVTNRFLTEATSLGFTPREVARYLLERVREGE
jgi:GntR family transcriptional regulator